MITVDLHSHILPGMDDGAKDTSISLELLKMEAEQGIEHIVLTPHFHLRNENITDFAERRRGSFEKLKSSISGTELDGLFDFRLGAEVRYDPSLTEERDLDSLCISGTNVLLIEFSASHHPEFAEEVFYRLQLRGYIILMAHVERFPWLWKHQEFLYEMVSNGAFAQFNADEILENRQVCSFVRKMLRSNLLHGIASDAHNTELRPPRIREAVDILTKDPGISYIEALDDFAINLLRGGIPDVEPPLKPRKSIWDLLKI